VRNALTVDVEEWFHVCGVPALGPSRWDTLESRVERTTRLLLDTFDRAGARATFFVVGWVAERCPRLVADIAAAGHQVGSHGFLHERAYDLGTARFREDLRASVAALGAITERPTCYRAPEWSINDRSLWALDVLAAEGFTLDASMAPVALVGNVGYPRAPHRRETPAGTLVEMPPLVADRFGWVMPLGWGWGLRMSAPRTVLQAIERTNQAGAPAVLTVHPWEIDPDPPRVPLPPRLRFAHYFRLDGFLDRLAAIVRGAAFDRIDAVAASLPSLSSRSFS
jgi:polysaccharide deacetylase family protein (PEP-CTERM system associated)